MMGYNAHTLDDIPCRETTATAADNDVRGKFICLEGNRCLTIIESECLSSYGVTPFSIKTKRHEVSILRWQKLQNSTEGNLIAATSGQYVDIYSTGAGCINALNSLRVHPLNATDMDWCAYNANLFVTCSIDDAINIWDLRDSRRASMRLHVVAGAEQAKWAPNANYYLCTAHGTDIRLWDVRNICSPLQSIPAHLQKICCVVWHPSDPLCFVTTSLDGYIKIWNFGDLTKPRHSIGVLPAPVWKVKFSFDGEEFASIPLPQRGLSSKNTLNVWRIGELDNAQAMKKKYRSHICDEDIILDVCWQKSESRRRSFKYLYSVSRSGKLRRYPLSPYEGNSKVDITTPIPVHMGNVTDLDSIPLTLEMKNITDGQSRQLSNAGDMDGSVIPIQGANTGKISGIEEDTGSILDEQWITPPESRPLDIRSSSSQSSPVSNDHKLWLTLPDIGSQSINTELEALRNLGTQGLFTDEIDMKNSKVSLSYVHYATNSRMQLTIRVVPNYNGTGRCVACVEVLQPGGTIAPHGSLGPHGSHGPSSSSISREHISRFLELLNKEACTYKANSQGSLLAYTMRRIPHVIDTMKIFVPKSIAIPRVIGGGVLPEVRGVAAGGAATVAAMLSMDERHLASRSVDSMETPKARNFKPGSLSPSQFRVQFDKWVPSPRTCGAQFNGSGLFVVFGPVNLSKRKETSKQKEELTKRGELKWISSENISLDVKRGRPSRRTSRHSMCDMKERDGAAAGATVSHDTPRSLDDYNQELLAAYTQMERHPTPPPHIGATTTTGEIASGGNPESRSPNSTVVDFYAQFVNTTGLIGGANRMPPPKSLQIPATTATATTATVPLLQIAHSTLNRLVHGGSSGSRLNKISTSSNASAASGRSFSVQNVPLGMMMMSSHRNRGSSLTGVLADDHYQPAEGGTTYSRVVVYDVSELMSVSKGLAKKYRLIGRDALQLCKWNKRMVDEEGRRDLLKVWEIVELCVRAGRKKWRRQLVRMSTRLHEQQKGHRKGQRSSYGVANTGPKPASNYTVGEAVGKEEYDEDEDEEDEEDDEDEDENEDENENDEGRDGWGDGDGTTANGGSSSGSWAIHPFGRNLINSLLDYFGRINDYQTAAMIICVLSERIRRNFDVLQKQHSDLYTIVPPGSLHHLRYTPAAGGMVVADSTDACMGQSGKRPATLIREHQHHRRTEDGQKSGAYPAEKEKSERSNVEYGFALEAQSPPSRIASFFSSAKPRLPKRFRLVSENNPEHLATPSRSSTTTNSSATYLYDESLTPQAELSPNQQPIAPIENAVEITGDHVRDNSLLDPLLRKRFGTVQHQYADLLFRWRMYSKCAEVMKYSHNAPIALPLWIRSKCARCGQKNAQGYCARCNAPQPPLLCAICQLPVKGLLTACGTCHHGGHSEHMLVWFSANTVCPCGCGCECKAIGCF